MDKNFVLRPKPSVGARIITGIVAAILSVLLVITLVFIPFLNDARAFVKLDNLQNYADAIDFEEVAKAFKENSDLTDEDLRAADFICGALMTDEGREILDIFVQQTVNDIQGKESTVRVTGDMVHQFLIDHIDDVYAFTFSEEELKDLEESINNGELTREELDQKVLEHLGPMAEEIVASLPSLNDLPDELYMIVGALSSAISTGMLFGSILSAVILALLVYVCKTWMRKGLVWLSVDFGIAMAFTIFIGALIGVAGKTMEVMPGDLASIMTPFAKPFLIFIANKTLTFAIIYALIIIGLIVWKCAYNSKVKRAGYDKKGNNISNKNAPGEDFSYGYKEASGEAKPAQDIGFNYGYVNNDSKANESKTGENDK